MISCDFSPNGEYLLTGGKDKKMFILNRSCDCVSGEFHTGGNIC